MTLVLTAVAFKFVVAQFLPNIPYNTCRDYYILIAFLIQTLIVLELRAGRLKARMSSRSSDWWTPSMRSAALTI